MANIPGKGIPYGGYAISQTEMRYDGSCLIVNATGEITIKGSIKAAAVALHKFVSGECCNKTITFILNDAIKIDIENGFKLTYLKENKPDFFDELVIEFERINKLKAFW